MGKSAAGVLVGAIVYFIWGFVSWAVLPWHKATMKPLPEEALITDTMKVVIKEPGFYVFPHDKTASGQPVEKDVWEQRHRAGPVGLAVVRPEGGRPMEPLLFVKSAGICLAVAALVMFVLWAASGRFSALVHRIHLAAALGLLSGVAVHLPYWNWFSFPAGVTIVGILDLTVGFALLGAAMSRFVPAPEGVVRS